MASGGGKAGKAGGQGHGAGNASETGQGPQGKPPGQPRTRWLARDVRETGQGPQGKPPGQPRTRKLYDCKNCEDLCCGLARALVAEAFELGAVTMSRKVSLGHFLVFGI